MSGSLMAESSVRPKQHSKDVQRLKKQRRKDKQRLERQRRKDFRNYLAQCQNKKFQIRVLTTANDKFLELEEKYGEYAEFWLLCALGSHLVHPTYLRYSKEQLFRSRAAQCDDMTLVLQKYYAELLVTEARRRRVSPATPYPLRDRYLQLQRRAERILNDLS